MAEEVSLDLLINAAESAKSVSELKKSLRDLKNAAIEAGSQGNDALANKYTSAAAKAKDKIEDLNKAINSTKDASARIESFAKIGQTIAGGFAAAQGAAALFGSENKNIAETLLKVQAATAILQGVQSLADGAKQAGIIKNIALEQVQLLQTKLQTAAEEGGIVVRYAAATAQRVLNAVMNANPIALVTTAIVTLTAALFAYSKLAGGEAKKSQEELTKEQEKYNEELEKEISISLKRRELRTGGIVDQESEIKILKASGASKEEIFNKEKKLIQERINQLEYAKNNRGIQLAEELKQEKSLKADLIALEANFQRESAEQRKKDAEEALKKRQEELKKRRDTEFKHEQEQIAFEKSIDEEAAKAVDENFKDLQDKNKANVLAQREDAFAEFLAKQEQIKTEAQFKLDNEKLTADQIFIINQEAQANIEKLDDDFRKSEIAKINDQADRKELFRQQEIQRETALRQARLSIATSTIQGLGALTDIFIKDGKKAAKFKKALTLAQIAADTAAAIGSLTAASNANPLNAPTSGIAGAAQFASGIVQILANIAKAKQLLSAADPDGGGGGSSSASGASPLSREAPTGGGITPTGISPVSNSTILTPTGSQNGQTLKVFVTETDITTSQNRISAIKNKATIGE